MRVAVIGGGVIGLSCARALALEGAGVVVVERGTAGGGCSAGNGGWICPSISVPLPSPALTVSSLLQLMRPDSPLHINPSTIPHLAPFLFQFHRHCTQRDFERGAQAMAGLAADAMDKRRVFVSNSIDRGC
jgi:D-amino-acid dehydrogenase